MSARKSEIEGFAARAKAWHGASIPLRPPSSGILVAEDHGSFASVTHCRAPLVMATCLMASLDWVRLVVPVWDGGAFKIMLALASHQVVRMGCSASLPSFATRCLVKRNRWSDFVKRNGRFRSRPCRRQQVHHSDRVYCELILVRDTDHLIDEEKLKHSTSHHSLGEIERFVSLSFLIFPLEEAATCDDDEDDVSTNQNSQILRGIL